MAQYPIPQFIEAEGKIVSFLTFSQFFWLVGGGAACLFIYYLLPFFLFIILAPIIGLFVVLVAFVKINNMSAVQLFLNFLLFSTGSKNYVWKKKQIAYPFKTKNMQNLEAKGIADSKIHNIKDMIEYRKK